MARPEDNESTCSLMHAMSVQVPTPSLSSTMITIPIQTSRANNTPAPRSQQRTTTQEVQKRWSSSSRLSDQYILFSWWFEVFSGLSALASFCALVGILVAYHHRTAPQWPQSLTINTVVAILTTIIKSAIVLIAAEGIGYLKWAWFAKARLLQHLALFDRASRGPKGAMELLIMLPERNIVASLGCLITALALAVDPFAQQLIRFYDCSLLQPGNSTIPRSNWYMDQGRHLFAGQSVLALSMQASMLTGLYDDAVPDISFTCPTGNCTFMKNYSTMGYCSSCEEITSDLRLVNLTQPCYGSDCSPGCQVLNISLPSGLSSYYNDCPGVIEPFQWTSFVANTTGVGANQGPPGSHLSVEMIFTSDNLWNYYSKTGYYSSADCEDVTDWQCSRLGAARCELYPCVQKRSASINAGKLTEVLLDASQDQDWTLITIDNFYPSLVDLSCLTRSQYQSFIVDAGYKPIKDYNWLPYKATWCASQTPDKTSGEYDWYVCKAANNPTDPIPGFPGECLYTFYYLARSNVDNYMATMFTGALGTPLGEDTFTGPTTLQIFDTSSQADADVIIGFNTSFATVKQRWSNIAKSITNRIRTTEQNPFNGFPAAGMIWKSGTCIHVRWGWLAYPATLLLMTACFLCTVLLEISAEVGWRRCTRDWKSSPLPLAMAPGLAGIATARNRSRDPEVRHSAEMETDRPLTERQIRDCVGRVAVRLDLDEDGWRFVPS